MPRRAARRLRARLGRRGPFLAFMGIGKICFGASFIFSPPITTQGLGMLIRWAPLHCWAWVWILAGAVTFSCAWLRFTQDGLGFVTASIPPAMWAFTYGWSGILGDYPRGLWLFGWYITSHCGVIWCASRVPPDTETSRPVGQVTEGRPE